LSAPIVDYQATSGAFYDDQTDARKVGRFRAWYHTTRYQRLRDLVASLFAPGMVVLDAACGNCVWNTDRLPVLGVDINYPMLHHAVGQRRLAGGAVIDMSGRRLCLASESVDVIVCSEVLEHMPNYPEVMAEFHRVLKPGGTLIATVPFDAPGTPFFMLFNAHCLFRGYALGEEYYKRFCGHVNHFTHGSMRRPLEAAGFEVRQQFLHNAFILYTIARRRLAGVGGA
jgi:ubiquinone/menaquinone biosynthesis C-methylase UbiE